MLHSLSEIGRMLPILTLALLCACRTTSSAPISEEVPPGYRVVAIAAPASEVGVVRPRDRIDILVTRPSDKAEPRGPRTAATIFQNVLVLRVGAIKNEKGTVYIVLNPGEAQYAVLEDLADNFHITLRGKGDGEMGTTEKVEVRKLFR